MSSFRPELTPEVFNGRSAGHLPGLVGLQILTMTPQGASGLGRRGDCGGHGQEDCLVPVYPDGPVAQVDNPGPAMFQSPLMTRWTFGYFFHFPRLLAEGNG
jgi:hypothetical protein